MIEQDQLYKTVQLLMSRIVALEKEVAELKNREKK
jgi:hypothetical protein